MLIAHVLTIFQTVLSYFVPLNNVPLFGTYLANEWLWSVNFSPAYVGQGIIMGPQTTFSMLLGALIGYAVLSPVAKTQGWAPGPTDDWKNGSKGWVVWVSLAIMLADSLVNLAWMVLRPLVWYSRNHITSWQSIFQTSTWKHFGGYIIGQETQYTAIGDEDTQSTHRSVYSVDEVTPTEHMISNRTTLIGLVLSCIACIVGVHYTFGNMIPFTFTILALLFAMVLSIMGVRALGETDLNPVSGISKLTQLVFAFFTPKGNKNAIIINLIAGALSESGALQAGDLMQDLKAGHLIGASPKAQFYGQIIGSAVGAVVSAIVYKLYTNVYEIPGSLFE
jgi:OPT family oligopeptide transporter